jgi:hypothetical protein
MLRLKLKTAAAVFLMLFAVGAYAQQRTVPPKTQPAARVKYTLSFKTGFVMRSGDVKVLALTNFDLLDRDPEQILTEAGYLPQKRRSILDQFDSDSTFSKLWPDAKSRTEDNPYWKAAEAFRQHTVASTRTDLTGIGKFTVPAGVYYVYGRGSLGNTFPLWNEKVDLRANKSITLDNHNAAEID